MYNICKRQTLEIKLKQGPRALLLPLLVFLRKEREMLPGLRAAQCNTKPRESHRLLGSLRHRVWHRG